MLAGGPAGTVAVLPAAAAPQPQQARLRAACRHRAPKVFSVVLLHLSLAALVLNHLAGCGRGVG